MVGLGLGLGVLNAAVLVETSFTFVAEVAGTFASFLATGDITHAALCEVGVL